MIRVRWMAVSFVMRQRCFPHIGMFSFLHRECINLHEGRLRNKMQLHSTLKGCFCVCVKRFWPITRVENNIQETSTILHVPHIGFLCYSNWDQILLYGRWLESKDEYICTALWNFLTFAVWANQKEVQTIKKLAPSLNSNMFVAVQCYRSYLNRFLRYSGFNKEEKRVRKSELGNISKVRNLKHWSMFL